MPEALSATLAVVVIGAGTMGSGIAEVAATAGHTVLLSDANEAELRRGVDQIGASLDKRVARGRLDTQNRDAILARIQPLEAARKLNDVGLVIEAIVEDLEAKASVLTNLGPRLSADTIIATNTSSLSITALAARLAHPERVVGMHFFNPATVLPLVEVVSGCATAPEVARTIVATARAWGKTPVMCRSTPGFIVNRIARPYYGEALRLLQEMVASPQTLDAVMRECGGFRMGPCELMDLIGHDINFAVTRSVYQAFFNDPRYQPSLLQQELVDAGWLGRKSGRGFFGYRAGGTPPPAEEADGMRPTTVRIEGDLGPACVLAELIGQLDGINVERTAGAGLLRIDGKILALTDGRTATERSVALGESVVLFDLALDFANCPRIALAVSAQAGARQVAAVVGLFAVLGKKVSVLADAPGLAVMRTVAMLVNEAADALHQGIASATDIDDAMCKGVNYPLGPLAWGRRIGFDRVELVLRHLAQAYGEDRYRTSPWLRRAVQAASLSEKYDV